MKLIFLHGRPAVGKLTVARELAALTNFKLFHNHLTVDLVSSLFPFGSEPFILLREKIWLAAFAEAARNDLSLIFTFNPERTVRERFVKDVIEVVEAAGGVALDVEVDANGRVRQFGRAQDVDLVLPDGQSLQGVLVGLPLPSGRQPPSGAEGE